MLCTHNNNIGALRNKRHFSRFGQICYYAMTSCFSYNYFKFSRYVAEVRGRVGDSLRFPSVAAFGFRIPLIITVLIEFSGCNYFAVCKILSLPSIDTACHCRL